MSEPLSSVEVLARLMRKPPRRDTFPGWQHFRTTRRDFVPAPRITIDQWRTMSPADRAFHDMHRTATHVNLPLQETPMALKVSRLVNRRINNNTWKQTSPTLSGVMVNGLGYHGKTETICEVTAAFEDQWLALHDRVNPSARPGSRDLHAPVAHVQTPVTAKPKSTCEAILNFFGAPTKGLTLPQLVKTVADSLDDHGVRALVLDDITRLRMHRLDDQDVLDLIRAFMSMNVTLILVGVDIPGSGPLREASWDAEHRQWVMPPATRARSFGREPTQTEHRFDLVDLDRFRYTTPQQIQAFQDHLVGIEDGLRLFRAEPGMLTTGSMPEYLMRRTGGVVGLLARLIEDGAQEAIDSGHERIDESLLDEIVLSLDDPTRDPGAGEIPAIDGLDHQPAPAGRKKSQWRPRNTVFDDAGPAAAGAGA
ncbi:AAA family ATPase [Kitasatospora sp. McL0602]|uniref:AAA family ATPase n=1 Tax=Kitasatospora sp. McL0602 TaxID=3439530 RepID=UPI003F89E7B0